ncbi:MAG: phosphatase PAP2 family protein [Clostridia bacterium]|nr:phosphatase PAP2 family protein [Clostridia bacterium]
MEFLKLLEGIRIGFLDKFFLIVTALGEEIAFMAIAIVVFWCFSKKYGYYILSVGFVGTIINQFLKLVFRIPRPWVLDGNFKPVEGAIEEATGYSFPSGHTQSAVGTFGSIAYITKKRWLRILSIVLCVLVPFSRMYLGVHTPLDVSVSIVIALLLTFLIKPVIELTEKNDKVMYIFLGGMLLISIGYLLFVELFNFPADVDLHNYESGLKNAYTLFGALLGMIISYPIEKRFIRFETSGKWYTQVLKCVIGLALVVGIKELLKYPLEAIFPALTVARAIRYALIVIFAVIVYPLTFKLFKRLEMRIENRKAEKKKI